VKTSFDSKKPSAGGNGFPPIAGQADTERESRLDAERCTLEMRQRSTRRLDAGREPFSESPLFGGSAQGSLFS
jgi:hypothetical protein